MISYSRLVSWIRGKPLYAKYSDSDRLFNEVEQPKTNKDWISEYDITSEFYHCLLDFAKVKDGQVIKWKEHKIRSNYKVEIWVVLQLALYERATQCFDWKLVIFNRKKDMEAKEFSRDTILSEYKRLWDVSNSMLDMVEANFKEVDYLLSTEKLSYE